MHAQCSIHSLAILVHMPITQISYSRWPHSTHFAPHRITVFRHAFAGPLYEPPTRSAQRRPYSLRCSLVRVLVCSVEDAEVVAGAFVCVTT